MNRISPEVEARIIELWFQGFPRDEISRILMVGEGTVTEKLKSLPPPLEILRNLSKMLRKLELLPNDAVKGIRILQLLAENGVTPEQIPIFLETTKKASTEAGYQPEKVIQASIEIADFEKQTGKTYPEALKEFEELTHEIPTRRKESSELLAEIEEKTRLRDEALEKAKTTPLELSEFLECKEALREYRMSITDAQTVRKVLDNIKRDGGDSKHFVSLIKKNGSIARRVAYLERELITKQNELSDLLSKIKEYEQVVVKLHEEKTRLEIIISSQEKAIGMNNCQLNRIWANIVELERRRQALISIIGRKLNLSQEKIEELRLDFTYETMLAAIDNSIMDLVKRMLSSLR